MAAPGNWCTALVQLTSASGPVTGNTPGAVLPTVVELDENFEVTIDPTASTNGVAGKWLVRLVGITPPTLTEPGADPATTGWIRSVAASLGWYGGIAGGGNSIIVKWNGTSQTVAIGDVDANCFGVTISGAEIQVKSGGVNAFYADASATHTRSVTGDTSASLTETDATIIVNSAARFLADGTATTISSPDGSTCQWILNDTSGGMLLSAQPRIVADATATRLFSPDGATQGLVRDDVIELNAVAEVDLEVGGDVRVAADATTSWLASPDGTVKWAVENAAGTGHELAGATTQSTVGAAGGASALPATPSGYLKLTVNGSPFVVPYYAVS